MYRLLGSSTSDLLKVAGGLFPGGSGDASAASATTAAMDYLYGKEQARIQKLMDDADASVLKAGQAIDWWKWTGVGVGVAGAYFLLRRAGR